MTGHGHGHGPGSLDDPGFPTSSPYHTKDTLSPTAAPWAHTVPHAPGSGPGSGSGSSGTSTSSGLSPAGSLGLGGSAALRLPVDNLIKLPRLGADLSGGDAAAGATFSLSLMGGAGGAMPPPGAAAAAMAAAAASAGPRKAPEAVIDAGAPRMPTRVGLVQGPGGAAGGAAAGGAHGFVPARKRIMTAEDLKKFLEGQTVKDLMAFILSINEAVQGKKAGLAAEGGDPAYAPSPAVRRMCGLLSELGRLVDQVPPEQQSLRYGNPAFRTWHAKLTERGPLLLAALFPPEEGEGEQGERREEGSAAAADALAAPSGRETAATEAAAAAPAAEAPAAEAPASAAEAEADASQAPDSTSSQPPPQPPQSQQRLPARAAAVVELLPYLLDSFGNATRIDYGTGHETQFCALLYCLAKLGVFEEADRQGLGLVVFKQYLELMRKIQTTYWLEPAGSHGVWGLDDYQFLPFIWGAAQLVGHPMIKPKSIHNPDILEAYSSQYLYLGCIKFVKQVKKGPLAETSPMLNDISCVPTWAKVNSGMVKMYQVEVLSKFPIMQHFFFGSLLPFE